MGKKVKEPKIEENLGDTNVNVEDNTPVVEEEVIVVEESTPVEEAIPVEEPAPQEELTLITPIEAKVEPTQEIEITIQEVVRPVLKRVVKILQRTPSKYRLLLEDGEQRIVTKEEYRKGQEYV